MKKRHILLAIVGTMVMTGCGEPIYDLSDADMAKAANYVAGAVMRYNALPNKGLLAVELPQEELEEEVIDAPVETDASGDATEVLGQTGGNLGGFFNGTTDDSGDDGGVPNTTMTLSQALQEDDLSIVYQGCSLKKRLEEMDYFLIEPEEGNSFFVMEFSLKNTSDTQKRFSFMEKNVRFILKAMGQSIRSEQTLLAGDMATFLRTLEPGQEVDVKLIFEVSASTMEEIGSYSLHLKMGEEYSNILLE